MRIRSATVDDFVDMQHCNVLCMTTYYKLKYYMYLLCTWPQLSFIAENDKGDCVGYVMGKMGEEGADQNDGTVISMAVKYRYRRFGLARALMQLVLHSMVECFQAQHAYLDVRVSNEAAYNLYASLGFKVAYVTPKYYEDDEDGYRMVLKFAQTNKVEKKDEDRLVVQKQEWERLQNFKNEVF